MHERERKSSEASALIQRRERQNLKIKISHNEIGAIDDTYELTTK